MKYINEICAGCGSRIKEGDDIVVCPECGTPQHRECWQKERECVNVHLHGEGFEWQPKHSEEEAAPPEKKIVCPFCGHENPEGAKECENCSQPFEMYGKSILPPEAFGEGQNGRYSYKPPFEVEYKEPETEENHENGAPENQEKTAFIFNSTAYDPSVLGAETKDFAAYVRVGIGAYYRKFKRFEKGKKLSFNFAAFFLCPFWFFFRKLYKAGIVFLTLSLCLSIAFYNPISDALDFYSGIASQISEKTASGEMTDNDYAEITEKLEEYVGTHASSVYGYAGAILAVNLAAAFTADIIYKKKFLRDIEETENETQGTSQQRYALILRKGGVSLFAPLAAYFVMQLISSLVMKVFF